MDIISTWIYLDGPEESSEYPQVGKASHLPGFQKVYWRCVAVFFEMSVRNNPDCRHILFSNVAEDKLPKVDGLDLKSFLKERNVEVVTLPLTWQAPKGWHGKWRNQFYIFDILAHIDGVTLSNPANTNPAIVVLDSDCIVNRPLDGLFAEIRQHGLMALPMRFADDYNINGVTRADMRRIFAELDGGKDPAQNPEYCGGEIFAATLDKVREINQIAPRVWEDMNRRFREGQPKLNEEAHFLSYCYHRIGGWASLEKFIKRIWTSPKYSNVKPEDVELPIWHLPAEKTGGIALIFKRLTVDGGWWTADGGSRQVGAGRWTVEELSGMLGVTKRTKYLNLKHFLKHTRLYGWLKSG